MIKDFIKVALFISTFSLYPSLPLFAMDDEFELDVGNTPCAKLREIPVESFKKPRIKLTNITSYTKLSEIMPQMLESIEHIISTKYNKVPFVINTIEYSYDTSKGTKDWQYHVNEFMDKIARGIKVVKRRDEHRNWHFCFEESHYPDFRCYTIVVICNNEVNYYTRQWQQREEAKPLRAVIFPSGEGVYEQVFDINTGEMGWVSQQEEEDEERRADRRDRGLDSSDED
jgi:hypothetical protein